MLTRRIRVGRSASGEKREPIICSGEPEAVDLIPAFRHLGLHRCLEGPVLLVGRPLLDPLADRLLLGSGSASCATPAAASAHPRSVSMMSLPHQALVQACRGRSQPRRACSARTRPPEHRAADPPRDVFASNPWQAKHLSERIGRMSRLNWIGAAPAVAAARRRIEAIDRSIIGELAGGFWVQGALQNTPAEKKTDINSPPES